MGNLRSVRRAAVFATITLGTTLWYGCSEHPTEPPTGPSLRPQLGPPQSRGIQAAIAAQQRHTDALLRTPGVVGTAVGLLPNGDVGVKLFLSRPGVQGLPDRLDDVPVATEVTGQFVAFTDPTTKQRPAPVGFSVGHPNITAGTIGARVVDGSGNTYLLSNNHVLANTNQASIGDPALQPGPYDGGTLSDQIGSLAAFKPIDFSSNGTNTIDAAIADATSSDLGNATPADDGYGTPNATIFGDADGNGVFDDKGDLLGLEVQKYGRTTRLTTGQITGINATVDVCYEVWVIWCLSSARYVDQIIIGPGSFSDGGDSGSLIVTNDQDKNPVGLLFAGSDTQTIANRIDLVLNHFGVSIDGEAAAPPTPTTDVAITGVSAPGSVTGGTTTDVDVTVRNVGNQDVSAGFDVTLTDATDAVEIGTQSVPGLAAGETTTLTFSWNTTGGSFGSHTLTASHDFADDDPSNDEASTSVNVDDPSAPSGIHVGDLDGWASNDGRTWSATVEVTVHDATHTPLNGATVTGTWVPSGLASDECTTGELGGNGTCIFLYVSARKNVKSLTFTVTDVAAAGETYVEVANHDPDGSSDGTSITVNKP